ncbi:MAG: hypothetical protein L0Y55_21785, partial [Anaerolineales bacterium]|nr:hypothetical protein [Anaerolineales bacterium]
MKIQMKRKIYTAGVRKIVVETIRDNEPDDCEIKYFIVEVDGKSLKRQLKLDWGTTGHAPNIGDRFNLGSRTF